MIKLFKILCLIAPFLLGLLGCSGTPGGNDSEQLEQSAVSTAIYQINSGGNATGSFAADEFFSGGTPFAGTNAVTTSGVANAAPAAVYQTERYGNMSYSFTGLTASATYTVRLHFAEIYFTSAGSRVFNVGINGTQVLGNFDIFATAGANVAVVRDFTAVAPSSGTIVVQYTGVKDNAKSSGIELLSSAAVVPPPPPPPPPPAAQRVNSGGSAVSPFSADAFFNGGTAFVGTTTVKTSGVTNAAPAAVYQSERYGNYSYVFTGLTASAPYTVRLHFAEIYFTSAGSRVFNVIVNGTQVLTNLDVFVAAGGANTALVRDFTATTSSSGQIVVQYVSVKDNAKSSGIELFSTGGTTGPPNQAPTVATAAAANPSTVNGTTSTLSVLGADDAGEGNLTYTWAATGTPPASVAFSVNGTNAAKSTVATFTASGSYPLQATIVDSQGLATTSTVTVSVTVPQTTGFLPPGSNWKLAWSDEFNGTAVDQTVWNFWLSGQTRRSAVNQPSNTYVGGGNLTVRITDTGGQLTAGGLESKMGFGYGYFEVRSQILGGWATFWLQSPAIDNGTGNPALYGTEMDIQEACCPGAVQHAVHWNGYDAAAQFVAQPISSSLVSNQQNFNTYGIEWTPTQYKFWVNGQLSWTFTQAISQRSDEVIRLTQETNGDFCGGSCLYNVDYVRMYQAQ